VGYLGATELYLPANVSIGTDTSPLSLGRVASIIEMVSAEVDAAAAGAGYVIPIPTTATTAWLLVRRAVADGAAWRALTVVYPGMGGPGDRASIASEYRGQYLAFLRGLSAGELKLPGIDADAGTGGRELPRSHTFSAATAVERGASALLSIMWEP
jgi:hypothetical protein